jgi:DNA replication protein DnaC
MLVLNGIPGTGKTHLTRAALRELIRVGADVLWLPDGQMIDAIMGSFQYHNTAALMATYGHQSWLLIDDFGLSNRPLATLPFIDRIMDARWVGSEHGLRTLLTTNLNPGDMTDRTASRLEDTRRVRAITIDAPDYRRNHGNS